MSTSVVTLSSPLLPPTGQALEKQADLDTDRFKHGINTENLATVTKWVGKLFTASDNNPELRIILDNEGLQDRTVVDQQLFAQALFDRKQGDGVDVIWSKIKDSGISILLISAIDNAAKV